MLPTEESTSSQPRFSTDEFTARTAEYARKEPIRALGVAFVAGLILTLLPIGAIVAGLVRLALALIRPALMILGASKLYDEIQKRQ